MMEITLTVHGGAWYEGADAAFNQAPRDETQSTEWLAGYDEVAEYLKNYRENSV